MIRITVGMGSCGIASGAKPIYRALEKITKNKKNIQVVKVGCIGICKYEPIVEIFEKERRTTYINVKKSDIEKIIKQHIKKGNIVEELLISKKILNILDEPFIKQQNRIVLKNCGEVNPEDINDYQKREGYEALKKILKEDRKEILETIKKSKLRGRGGAGFYTGLKWESAFYQDSDIKYVCCNADEGDPGAFMDRAVLEGNPHSVIEAMIIAGYVIGSKEGYIYVRAEYPLAIERLKIAIKQAKEKDLLGKTILNSNFSFDIKLRFGAGAFVCGEETALIESIEGKRGEPRKKPPFPTIKGLYNKTTLINNVETYANIPSIILNGSEWFNNIGTEKSSGTKVFALAGNINKTGLVEVPIGTTLKEIIYNIGGGISNNKNFKAAQTGGPSGGCIPNSLIDVKMDYEDLKEIGTMMGSGGLIIMDEDTCMPDIAKFFLGFTVDESCGKCTPCRVGTKQAYEILNKITKGQAKEEDLKELEELSIYIKENSFCGLGQSATNPILSTLKYFRNEYIDHIQNEKCTAIKCKNLVKFVIDKESCIGCGVCYNNCPVNAIKKIDNKKYEIDQNKCIKCGICFSKCKFNSIKKI